MTIHPEERVMSMIMTLQPAATGFRKPAFDPFGPDEWTGLAKTAPPGAVQGPDAGWRRMLSGRPLVGSGPGSWYWPHRMAPRTPHKLIWEGPPQ